MTRRNSIWLFSYLFLFCICFVLAGCSQDTPLKIGLVAGLSGSNADLGHAGRNGAMLAVEQMNNSGGINGSRQVELLILDDGNDKAMAMEAAQSLVDNGVEIILGPFTTAMSEAVLAVAEKNKVMVFSPTASAKSLSGGDDYFFRLNSSTTDNARHYAEYIAVQNGWGRVAMVIDRQNGTFSRDWADAFVQKSGELGTSAIKQIWFDSGGIDDFDALVEQLLAEKPDAIIMVANAVDVARITQQLRKVDSDTRILAAEWAGTQQLIELGGKAVDGVAVLLMYDMFGTQPAYIDFLNAYKERFNISPSFSSILAYEATRVLLVAYAKQESGQSIKDAVLKNSPYSGLQQEIRFDANGDSLREAHFVVVDGNTFVPAGK